MPKYVIEGDIPGLESFLYSNYRKFHTSPATCCANWVQWVHSYATQNKSYCV
jgi:hypothetical protein